MGDLSAHFSRSEFRCHHCGRLVGPTSQLLAVLERLRARVGRPLRIVSGYRCPAHNAAVGGARGSRHKAGDAADIPSGYASARLAAECGAVGIGTKGSWAVHVDTRPGGPARWRY